MNILHHKSWHVRTKKNIEKVRQDEQRDLEKQTEKAKKADIAQQERRIQQLRDQFRTNNSDQQTLRDDLDSKVHVNFFQPEYDQCVNKAHELEKKLEKEQWEKKVGIVQYLGGNQRDNLPWYEKLPSRLNDRETFKDVSILERNDPLNQIKKELNKRKQEENNLKKSLADAQRFRNKFNSDTSCSKHEFKVSGHSELKKEKSKHSITNLMSEKELKLKILRDKRLKREEKESKRSQDLFSNKNLFDHCLNERERSYSNQFNPHLARK